MPERPTKRDTRDRILIAAATMLGENPTARLSVRGVAARAGVSTGSLRHFFPTQRALVDAVVAGIYDVDVPGDPIGDTARTPAERLVECLRQVLAQIGTGERAREQWRGIHGTYIAVAPTDDEVATYRSIERAGLHRIERWLTALADEGALPADDVAPRARFLATVLNGLFTERVLPADALRLKFEAETLRMAAVAVLSDPAGAGQSEPCRAGPSRTSTHRAPHIDPSRTAR
ncbi:TetR/AcrR family transcriptional regulator [Micromonospora okii]|uniref:TetR/AcrR family transcriptional regulator n=1 Tax=Micromonospora okii TaxID=1182970 RepID=UPI001E2DD6C6|nr:TetR/AcrR family transcriptional regulator [Micromonospora okii]